MDLLRYLWIFSVFIGNFAQEFDQQSNQQPLDSMGFGEEQNGQINSGRQPPNCLTDTSPEMSQSNSINARQLGSSASPFPQIGLMPSLFYCDNYGQQHNDLGRLANLLFLDQGMGLRPCLSRSTATQSRNPQGAAGASATTTTARPLNDTASQIQQMQKLLLPTSTVCLSNQVTMTGEVPVLANILAQNQGLGVRCTGSCPCEVQCPVLSSPSFGANNQLGQLPPSVTDFPPFRPSPGESSSGGYGYQPPIQYDSTRPGGGQQFNVNGQGNQYPDFGAPNNYNNVNQYPQNNYGQQPAYGGSQLQQAYNGSRLQPSYGQVQFQPASFGQMNGYRPATQNGVYPYGGGGQVILGQRPQPIPIRILGGQPFDFLLQIRPSTDFAGRSNFIPPSSGQSSLTNNGVRPIGYNINGNFQQQQYRAPQGQFLDNPNQQNSGFGNSQNNNGYRPQAFPNANSQSTQNSNMNSQGNYNLPSNTYQQNGQFTDQQQNFNQLGAGTLNSYNSPQGPGMEWSNSEYSGPDTNGFNYNGQQDPQSMTTPYPFNPNSYESELPSSDVNGGAVGPQTAEAVVRAGQQRGGIVLGTTRAPTTRAAAG